MRSFPIRPDVQAATSSFYDADGFLTIGVDGESVEPAAIPPVESMPPLGLFSRPFDPDTDPLGNPLPGKGCSLLRLVGDNDDQVVALTDPRVVGFLPRLGKGASCLYEPIDRNPDKSPVTDLARVTLNHDGTHAVLVHAPAPVPSNPVSTVTVEVAGGPVVTLTSNYPSTLGQKVEVSILNGPSVVLDTTVTPPVLTLSVPGGPSVVLDATNGAQVGGPGGQPLALASPAFLAWLAAIGAATSVGAPPPIAATKAKGT